MVMVRGAILRSLGGVVLVSVQGLCAAGQTGAKNAIQARIERVTACLRPLVYVKTDPCVSLVDRMEALHVPGVSVAVIHDWKIEWARGFGVEKVGGAAVTPETMFQAGSISKPVAAMAILRLVQDGKLKLDEDVNKELVSWKLPESAAANGKPVTLRELLTHTGGTTVHGFPGYGQGEQVPTIMQVLDGEKPANTPAVRVEKEPGTRWNYSGGGITIAQLMAMDSTKEPFPKLMHDSVLGPIGMTHSTYEEPLPESMTANAATPYNA